MTNQADRELLEAAVRSVAAGRTRLMRYTGCQPNNVDAWRIGEACVVAAAEQKCGDPIDRGLILMLELQRRGFGVYELPDADVQREERRAIVRAAAGITPG